MTRRIICALLWGMLLPLFVKSQGGVNVDLSTGRVGMTVPLWTMQSKDIQHPIALAYGGGGFKVGTPIGKAGLGWSLIAGGTITRELKGLPDDFVDGTRKGWLIDDSRTLTQSFNPQADDNWADATDEVTDYNNLAAFGGNTSGSVIKDTEPDIFHINVPGLGGSFIINGSSINTLPYSDLKIEPAYGAGAEIRTFKVTTSMGVTYHFTLSDTETIEAVKNPTGGPLMLDVRNYYSYESPVTYRKTWYLTEITSARGGSLEFNYDPVPFDDTDEYHINSWVGERQDTLSTYRYNSTTLEYEKHWEYYLDISSTQPWDLSSIVGSNSKVLFSQGDVLLPSSVIYTEPYLRRRDVLMKKPLLSEVKVYQLRNESGSEFTFRKSYLLNYGYASLLDSDNSHQVFLRSLTEKGRNQQTQEAFNFSYHGITYGQPAYIPVANSWAQDRFGYFNGGPNERFQRVFVYPSETGVDQYRTDPIAGVEGYILDGREGTPNLQALLAGNLATVTNALGGKTDVIYELNAAFDPKTNREVYAGGLRVKKVRVHDGMDRANDQEVTYEYQNANGQSSGLLMHVPTYAFTVGTGWDFTNSQPEYYDDLLAQDLTDAERWRRMVFRTERDIRYESQMGPSVVYSRATMRQAGKGSTVYHYSWPVTHGALNATEWEAPKTRVARSSATMTYLDFGPLAKNYAYPHGPTSNTSYRQGLMTKVEVFDEAGNIEEETVNEFVYLNSDEIRGLRIGQLHAPNSLQANEKMFVYRRYDMQTENTPLIKRSISKSFDVLDQNKWQSVTTEYTYPSLASPYPTYATAQFSTDSKGTKRGVNYKYAFDYSTPTSASTQDEATRALGQLKEKNIMALPIEVTQTYQEAGGSEQVMGGSIQEFKYLAGENLILMEKQYALPLASPVGDFQSSSITGSPNYVFSKDSRYEEISRVTQRDLWGNAVTQEGTSRVPVTTLAEYEGTLPVASFSHATYNQVAYENFENRNIVNPHGLQVGFTSPSYAPGRIYGQAITLNTSGQTLSKSIVKKSGNEFTVSFWVNTSATGNMTVQASDGTNTATQNVAFSTTNDEWEYYETTLDVSPLASTFTVTFSSNAAVVVDDVLIHPSIAQGSYVTYGLDMRRVASTSTGGISTISTFDDLNRLRNTKDFQNNLVRVMTYEDKGFAASNYADFRGPSQRSPGNPVLCRQESGRCIVFMDRAAPDGFTITRSFAAQLHYRNPGFSRWGCF